MGRVANQYCGAGAHTVCEDMEVVVRLLRYVLDRNQDGHIVFDPHPAAWTEAPEVYRALGQQRGRWYRGLLEVLWYHRHMLFDPRCRQVGLIALPYQLLFEGLAPLIEALGYIIVPLSMLAGVLSPRWALLMLFITVALNVSISLVSVALSAVTHKALGEGEIALFSYPRLRDPLLLLLAAILKNFGYRQYLLLWQLRGLRDFLKGRTEWDKFARRGFQPSRG